MCVFSCLKIDRMKGAGDAALSAVCAAATERSSSHSAQRRRAARSSGVSASSARCRSAALALRLNRA